MSMYNESGFRKDVKDFSLFGPLFLLMFLWVFISIHQCSHLSASFCLLVCFHPHSSALFLFLHVFSDSCFCWFALACVSRVAYNGHNSWNSVTIETQSWQHRWCAKLYSRSTEIIAGEYHHDTLMIFMTINEDLWSGVCPQDASHLCWKQTLQTTDAMSGFRFPGHSTSSFKWQGNHQRLVSWWKLPWWLHGGPIDRAQCQRWMDCLFSFSVLQ